MTTMTTTRATDLGYVAGYTGELRSPWMNDQIRQWAEALGDELDHEEFMRVFGAYGRGFEEGVDDSVAQILTPRVQIN